MGSFVSIQSNNDFSSCKDLPVKATPADDDELLLLDNNSELKLDNSIDDLDFMDFEEQMNMYDKMQEDDETILDVKVRNANDNSMSQDHLNKFKIQGLEEVTEMTEESDMTSLQSYNSELLSSNSSDNSNSSQNETIARIKMSEDIKELEAMSVKVFNEKCPIPFKFDFEDYDRCRLNGEIKKMIVYMKIKMPILQKAQDKYFIGVSFVTL